MVSTFDASDEANGENRVFVVHGRNEAAREAMFTFLKSIGLDPIEWSQAVSLTGEGSPYIGTVLEGAFAIAKAVVVLMTPDEIACLREEYASSDTEPDCNPSAQVRPNVLFEAGMAMGKDSERTILVEMGETRQFTDIAGRHSIRIDNSESRRKDLAQRLHDAGCPVDLSGDDWMASGDFSPPSQVSQAEVVAFLGADSDISAEDRVKVKHTSGHNGGLMEISNGHSFPIRILDLDLPPEVEGLRFVGHWLPDIDLPPGESITLHTVRISAPCPNQFYAQVRFRDQKGKELEESVYINLVG